MAIFDASPSSVFVVKHQFGRRWKQWDHRTAACVFWTYVARSWLLPVKRPAHQLANGDRHGMRSSTAHRAEYMLQFTVDLRINIVTQYTHIFSPSRGSEDVGERISTWNPNFILLYWSILVSFLSRLLLVQSSLVVARFILVARIHDPELCNLRWLAVRILPQAEVDRSKRYAADHGYQVIRYQLLPVFRLFTWISLRYKVLRPSPQRSASVVA